MNTLKKLGTLVYIQKLTGLFLIVVVLGGCANFGTPKNLDIADAGGTDRYSLADWKEGSSSSDLSLLLTFSGGGTRAAALSYGVMLELRDTPVKIDGRSTTMLDEIDTISSVSGGSFTSAYYGLFGDQIFEKFEQDFLDFDLEKHLIYRALNPALLFSEKGRTEAAIEYYNDVLFKNATFADMGVADRPMIVINASDLGYGIRFSFIQEYFDLLCSDLSSFPVAYAVAASSAVPVLFNPIVVQNHDTCSDMQLVGTSRIQERIGAFEAENAPVMLSQLESYAEKDRRKFIHFVDGGITDNLGLRAISDIFSIAGGVEEFMVQHNKPQPRNIAIILVDANTRPDTGMDTSNEEPSTASIISSVTGVQLKRYDAESKRLVKEKMTQWESQSTAEKPQKAHFISVSLQEISDPDDLAYFNSIPTSFRLDDEQVDRLIEVGRTLLRDNPGFRQLLSDIENP